MIEKVEPHKTGLVVMGLEDLLRGVVQKLNETIEKQGEIIDQLNKLEEIKNLDLVEELEKEDD